MSFYDEFNYDLLNNETKQSGGATVNKTIGWGKIGYPDDTVKNRRPYFKRKKKEEKLIEEEIYDMKETMFLSELPKEKALQDSTIEAMLNRKVIFERDYDMRFDSSEEKKGIKKSENIETYSVLKQNALTLKLSNALNDYEDEDLNIKNLTNIYDICNNPFDIIYDASANSSKGKRDSLKYIIKKGYYIDKIIEFEKNEKDDHNFATTLYGFGECCSPDDHLKRTGLIHPKKKEDIKAYYEEHKKKVIKDLSNNNYDFNIKESGFFKKATEEEKKKKQKNKQVVEALKSKYKKEWEEEEKKISKDFDKYQHIKGMFNWDAGWEIGQTLLTGQKNNYLSVSKKYVFVTDGDKFGDKSREEDIIKNPDLVQLSMIAGVRRVDNRQKEDRVFNYTIEKTHIRAGLEQEKELRHNFENIESKQKKNKTNFRFRNKSPWVLWMEIAYVKEDLSSEKFKGLLYKAIKEIIDDHNDFIIKASKNYIEEKHYEILSGAPFNILDEKLKKAIGKGFDGDYKDLFDFGSNLKENSDKIQEIVEKIIVNEKKRDNANPADTEAAGENDDYRDGMEDDVKRITNLKDKVDELNKVNKYDKDETIKKQKEEKKAYVKLGKDKKAIQKAKTLKEKFDLINKTQEEIYQNNIIPVPDFKEVEFKTKDDIITKYYKTDIGHKAVKDKTLKDLVDEEIKIKEALKADGKEGKQSKKQPAKSFECNRFAKTKIREFGASITKSKTGKWNVSTRITSKELIEILICKLVEGQTPEDMKKALKLDHKQNLKEYEPKEHYENRHMSRLVFERNVLESIFKDIKDWIDGVEGDILATRIWDYLADDSEWTKKDKERILKLSPVVLPAITPWGPFQTKKTGKEKESVFKLLVENPKEKKIPKLYRKRIKEIFGKKDQVDESSSESSENQNSVQIQPINMSGRDPPSPTSKARIAEIKDRANANANKTNNTQVVPVNKGKKGKKGKRGGDPPTDSDNETDASDGNFSESDNDADVEDNDSRQTRDVVDGSEKTDPGKETKDDDVVVAKKQETPLTLLLKKFMNIIKSLPKEFITPDKINEIRPILERNKEYFNLKKENTNKYWQKMEDGEDPIWITYYKETNENFDNELGKVVKKRNDKLDKEFTEWQKTLEKVLRKFLSEDVDEIEKYLKKNDYKKDVETLKTHNNLEDAKNSAKVEQKEATTELEKAQEDFKRLINELNTQTGGGDEVETFKDIIEKFKKTIKSDKHFITLKDSVKKGDRNWAEIKRSFLQLTKGIDLIRLDINLRYPHDKKLKYLNERMLYNVQEVMEEIEFDMLHVKKDIKQLNVDWMDMKRKYLFPYSEWIGSYGLKESVWSLSKGASGARTLGKIKEGGVKTKEEIIKKLSQAQKFKTSLSVPGIADMVNENDVYVARYETQQQFYDENGFWDLFVTEEGEGVRMTGTKYKYHANLITPINRVHNKYQMFFSHNSDNDYSTLYKKSIQELSKKLVGKDHKEIKKLLEDHPTDNLTKEEQESFKQKKEGHHYYSGSGVRMVYNLAALYLLYKIIN